jgi:hypothetical protein
VQTGLDLCWSQTHYVGFVVARIISLLQPLNTHTVAVNITTNTIMTL